MLEAALSYAKMGLAVIPLHGKRPFFDNWVEVATSEPKTVERWWTQGPHDNIGIATGPKSKVFVFDVDPRNGGKDTYEMLQEEHGAFPDTWQVVTGGGGIHLYFRYPAFSIKSVSGVYPGIDIKGDGGQVVAPPSIHPDTHAPYEWDGLTPFERQRIAEAPPWLLERLEQNLPRKTVGMGPLPLKIHYGVQHQTLVSFAGKMRQLGLDEEEIFQATQMINTRRCERPGPQQNIRQIAHSMMRYQPAERSLIAEANKLWQLTRFHEQHRATGEQLQLVDGLSVFRAPVPESTAVIDDMLHDGLTVFAGRSKSGKSYLTLQLAIAVATGVPVFGKKTIRRPGRVAYFSLEEPQEDTTARMRKIVQSEDACLQNIEFAYTMPPFKAGGRQQMERYLQTTQPSVIIIDSLSTLMGLDQRQSGNVFRSEYQEIKSLRELALESGSAMIVIHHAKKGVVTDSAIEAVSGTMGITAAADSIWRLQKREDGTGTLEMVGRKMQDQTYALRFDLDGYAPGWGLLAEGQDARHSEERDEIVELLREEGPISGREIAMRLRKNENTIRTLLRRLRFNGKVVQNSDKKWVAAND